MKIYLVGGAVRDKLLGIPVKEKDWVVVGATPKEMLDLKFKQVGKDFPVFIHPKTGEEYALARTERKSGHGYTGFTFDANPNVTLEEDLKRRDLAINAIAEDEDGNIIDPFNGQKDIKDKKLRHVSDAFSEDPLRVLRIARFCSKLDDFVIVPRTMAKIKEIVQSGELEYLTPERVWLEIHKSIDYMDVFFDTLNKMGAKDIIFPELCNNQSLRYMLADDSSKISKFVYYIYRQTFNHHVKSFCEKYKVPNEYRYLLELMHACAEEYEDYEPLPEYHDPLLSLVKRLDIRQEERLKQFMDIFDLSSFKIYPSAGSRNQFFRGLINKIKSYKLKKEHQNKSNKEIQKIVDNDHREITQDYLRNFFKNNPKPK